MFKTLNDTYTFHEFEGGDGYGSVLCELGDTLLTILPVGDRFRVVDDLLAVHVGETDSVDEGLALAADWVENPRF